MTRFYIYAIHTQIGNPDGYATQTDAIWDATQLTLKGYENVYITKTGADGEMTHVLNIN